MIIACPSCQKKNRVKAEHLADVNRCGSCKRELPAISAPIDADPSLFDEITAKARVPILVDFWASWCGPCRRAAPEVARTAEELAGQALVLKVNTEKHPELGARFRVQGIPSFLVMRDGRVVFQQAGLVSSSEMTRWLLSAASARV
ncbi:MAG TPA: thioredoxin domain-containing protein [Thermoanaerobaculia bacterium]|nr:thioredoxin domain-containing protein [Thermoanaerobaculia bacterium]